jgi:multimeric flavodoxin WrbA
VRFLELTYPEHEFTVINAGASVNALRKDMTPVKASLTECDAVIFSYPVYTFIAPSQLHEFIRLVKESEISLSGKYVSQITTSKHFYDVTAHKYIEENCHDLGMKYIRGLSADMDDLLTERGREEAKMFFDRFLWSIREDQYERAPEVKSEYTPIFATKATQTEKKQGKEIVIVTDCTNKGSSLYAMIERFKAVFPYPTRTVNIQEFSLKGGCLGCFSCAVSGKCVYKDGFDELLRNDIQKADAIVYAFTVSDHSMGVRFKMYDDRNFCNGHRTVTEGMPVGYLVSGELSREENLKTIIEGRGEVGGNFVSYVATDEKNTDGEIDKLSARLTFALETGHRQPSNFLGVGGMKIFRDLIYQMRGMMRADHKFFKAHGQYDFPQKKKLLSMKMYLVGALLSSEKIKAKMGNKMNEGMLMPYNKLFEKLKKQENKQKSK